jgi:LPXTG-motif cell wall-anchored protein
MGRRTTNRSKPRHPKTGGAPSPFFIIAMILALALLAWGFFAMVSRPMPVQ